MIAAGLPWPRPAMSCPVPCATEENSTGLPIAIPAVRRCATIFAAMCPWSWNITRKAS
jgi:hypothetical protein